MQTNYHYVTYMYHLDSDPHSKTFGDRLAFRRVIETPGQELRFEEWDLPSKTWKEAPPLMSIFGRGKTPRHITVPDQWVEREILRAGGTVEDLIIQNGEEYAINYTNPDQFNAGLCLADST